jgi:hypothetical protein
LLSKFSFLVNVKQNLKLFLVGIKVFINLYNWETTEIGYSKDVEEFQNNNETTK